MKSTEIATFAGGCFWCADAVFRRIRGIETIISGFTGGEIKNPAYREVVQGLTKHAEAVQLEFDPEQISFRELLLIFFATHDPTALNRQGHDIGAHYRSAIFYHSDTQKNSAEEVIQLLNDSVYSQKIVTQLKPATPFYPAETIHQDFYDRNREVPYCKIVIDPKIDKLRQQFADKLR